MNLGHCWTEVLKFLKRQIFSAKKNSNDVDYDRLDFLLTNESKVFEELPYVGFHDILYRYIDRVIEDGFDVPFGNNVKKCEKSTCARSRNLFEIV